MYKIKNRVLDRELFSLFLYLMEGEPEAREGWITCSEPYYVIF